MITPIPGAAVATNPASPRCPSSASMSASLTTSAAGGSQRAGQLVIKEALALHAARIWGDKKRFQETYWSEFKGWYFVETERDDKDGYIRLPLAASTTCSTSPVIVSGTAEVESALVSHPAVAESAVVGRPDEMKGQGVVCFVTVKEGVKTNRDLADELKKHVRKVIGPVATPDEIRFAAALPKTRSGKIMRRLLKQIAAGEIIKGDTTTLEDINVIAALAASGDD
ncbi:MAG: hypothetical protein R3F13_09280 [Prosthecobacter sp.]